MSDDRLQRVEQACAELVAASEDVTFDAVAARAGIGRATLYRRPELHAVVHEHRQRALLLRIREVVGPRSLKM